MKAKFTRKLLSKMNKLQLFDIYIKYFNDEMSPIMWRGYTKAEVIEWMLDGMDEVEANFES
jgi:hypothetical protein